MANEIYRHYFKNDTKVKEFSYKEFKPIKNWEYTWVKPHGGLWASRLSSKLGWKEWCEDRELNWCEGEFFDFYISDKANILYLKNEDDIAKIIKEHANWVLQCTESLRFIRYLRDKEKYIDDYPMIPSIILNFQNILKDGVDALDVEIDKLYYPFFGWDCDSTLIMNPDIIILKED